MPVSENDLVVGPVVLANGVSLISLDFVFLEDDDIQVFRTGTFLPLTRGVHYTLAGSGTVNGSITLTTPANGTDQYAVFLVPTLERASDMQLRGQFQSDPFNVELDRVWRSLQYLNTRVGRALLISETSIPVGPMIAESAASRADRVPVFSPDGTRLTMGPTASAVAGAQANAQAAEAAAAAAAASAAEALAKENSMLRDRGAWATTVLYSPSDIFTYEGRSYITQTSHFATTVAADQGAGRIRVFADKGAAGSGSGDMLKSENLSGLLDPPSARTNLGVAIGSQVQAFNANLNSLAGITLQAGDILYATGPDTLVRLPIGADGTVLGKAAGVPAWVSSGPQLIATWEWTTNVTTIPLLDLAGWDSVRLTGSLQVGADFGVHLSPDNGATWRTTSGYVSRVNDGIGEAGSTADFRLARQGAGTILSIDWTLQHMSDATVRTSGSGHVLHGQPRANNCAGVYMTAEVCTAIRIANAGTITGGWLRVYGERRA